MLSPNRSVITSLDFGPWTCIGPTSGSLISTFSPELYATPWAQSSASLSASESQKWFSARRRRTGSLMMPPRSSVMNAYLHWPTSHLLRSRGVSMFVNLNASGPRSEEHTSELQSRQYLVCRLLLEKKKQ